MVACVHIFDVDKHICHELLNITTSYLVEMLMAYLRIGTLYELSHSGISYYEQISLYGNKKFKIDSFFNIAIIAVICYNIHI